MKLAESGLPKGGGVGYEIFDKSDALEGRLIVMADPAMAAGNCRIEWSDGGVIRDRAATLATIDDQVDRYITARQGRTR